MTSRLEDAFTAPKNYCNLINHLLYKKKIPAILVDGNFDSDFNKKSEFLNNFFGSICTLIINAITLSYFSYRTNSRISSFHATEKDILPRTKSLDPPKAHGYENLSVRMIKICSESITIPLKIIFMVSLKNGVFPEIWKRANVVPEIWKRANVVPVHKKKINV